MQREKWLERGKIKRKKRKSRMNEFEKGKDNQDYVLEEENDKKGKARKKDYSGKKTEEEEKEEERE